MKIIRHAKGVNLLFELTKEETQTLETKGVLIKGNYVIVKEESKKLVISLKLDLLRVFVRVISLYSIFYCII